MFPKFEKQREFIVLQTNISYMKFIFFILFSYYQKDTISIMLNLNVLTQRSRIQTDDREDGDGTAMVISPAASTVVATVPRHRKPTLPRRSKPTQSVSCRIKP